MILKMKSILIYKLYTYRNGNSDVSYSFLKQLLSEYILKDTNFQQ